MKIALLLFLIFVTKTSCNSFEDLLKQISTKEVIPGLSQLVDKHRQVRQNAQDFQAKAQNFQARAQDAEALLHIAGEFSLNQGFVCFMTTIRTYTNGIFQKLRLGAVNVTKVDWPGHFYDIVSNYDYAVTDNEPVTYETTSMISSYRKWFAFLTRCNKTKWSIDVHAQSIKLGKALNEHFEERTQQAYNEGYELCYYYTNTTVMYKYVAAVLTRSYKLGVFYTHELNDVLDAAITRNEETGGNFLDVLLKVMPYWYFTEDMVTILNIVYRELGYKKEALIIGEKIQVKLLDGKLHDMVIPCSFRCLRYPKSVPYLYKYLTTTPTTSA